MHFIFLFFESSNFGGNVMHEVMHAMHFWMQISDWIIWVGLPFSKVRSFLDTNVDWIWFYEDAINLYFCFFVVAIMDWTLDAERIWLHDTQNLTILWSENGHVCTSCLKFDPLPISCVLFPERTSTSFPYMPWRSANDFMSVLTRSMHDDCAFVLT